ncbi:MAG: transglycosylase domain-containing protein [Actinobacteria bacterium]|nr:transglycosylase domain-containing protein [Actinomycetota bacterium]
MTAPDDLREFLIETRRRRRWRVERLRRRRRAGATLGLVAVVIAGLAAAATVGTGAALSAGCSLSSLKPVQIGENSFLYAADGSLLGSIPAERNREPIALAQMGRWLPMATVAVEDRRFYSHGGVDYVGIARALWRDVSAGKVVQGGSTIAQQLVRNLYVGQERTLQRKLKEACLAIKLSERWSKQKILEDYLNTVYYGDHAYGAEAAAQTFFSKDAGELDLRQAALIAGLPQAPSVYDPLHDPRAALARRDEVLQTMLADGAITRAQYRWAISSRDLHLVPGSIYTRIREPYFFSYVISQLENVYGANTVRDGGLRVYTTIEPRLQLAAVDAIKTTLNEKNDPAAAIVSVVPGTGAIRAMAAVIPGNTHNQFNLAAQSAREAGSTFKAFVLATAIEQGMDPDTTYYTSAPFVCTTGPWCAGDAEAGKPWQVSTYDHTYAGTISVTQATLRSDNTVYAQLTLDAGPDNVWKMAKRLGVHLTQKPVASIGLGPLAVSPLDMAAAYATFASGGVYATPTAIAKVVLADGTVDRSSGWGVPQTKRVLSQGVAWKVNDVLHQNALYGTGYGSSDGVHPNAGKTGTTEDHADAWFVGYTRDLSSAVWMGYPGGEIPMLDVHGLAVAGATFPVPIWHLYMAAAEKGLPPRDFLTPKNPPSFRAFTHHYYGYLATTATTTTTTAVAPGPAPPPAVPKPGRPVPALPAPPPVVDARAR